MKSQNKIEMEIDLLQKDIIDMLYILKNKTQNKMDLYNIYYNMQARMKQLKRGLDKLNGFI
jgi:hypothetical protein